MTATEAALLKVGRTQNGHVVRLEGRGTMRESWHFRQQCISCLEAGDALLTVDLCECRHLDSTFLGALVSLHKSYNTAGQRRFQVAASEPQCQRLLHTVHLDDILPIVSQPPSVEGSWIGIPCPEVGSADLGRHVMQCHRRLAELGGPNEAVFRQIADRLAMELQSPKPST